MRLVPATGIALLLSGCILPSRPERHVAVLPRFTDADRVVDAAACLEAVDGTECFVVKHAADLAALNARFGLDLFRERPVDFTREMVVGAVDARRGQKRSFNIFRVQETPERLEVQVVSHARGAEDRETTPYVFLRLPATPKPVRFFLNGVFAYDEGLAAWGPGSHDALLTRDTAFKVFIPEGVPGPLPLLVLLHGSTISAEFIRKFEPMAQARGYALLAVSNRNGYYWTELDEAAVLDAMGMLQQRCPIDTARVFVGGGSAGGHTAYGFALAHRNRFKGCFAFCGRMNPAVSDEDVAGAKDMPVFIMLGTEDKLVSRKSVEEGKARLEKAGARVAFHLIEGAGHDLLKDPGHIRLLFDWLAEVDAPPAADCPLPDAP